MNDIMERSWHINIALKKLFKQLKDLLNFKRNKEYYSQ